MMQNYKKFVYKRAGIAAVEMALCLPFVMLVLFGILEFYRIVQVKHLLTNAAREGCRLASQRYIILKDGSKQDITIENIKTLVVSNLRSTFVFGFNPESKNYNNLIFQSIDDNISFKTLSSNGITVTSTNTRPPYMLNKGEIFQVDISLPYKHIKLFSFDFGVFNFVNITGSSRMVCLLNKETSFDISMPLPSD